MAKKLNSFAADFEGLNKSADDKVFAMLKSAESTNEAPTEPAADVKPKKPKAVTEIEQAKTEHPKAKIVKTEKSKNTRPSSPAEWGRPTAHFNTRIPEKMAELLDDLVYKLKKNGEQKTKQDLALEAIHDLLRKHSIC